MTRNDRCYAPVNSEAKEGEKSIKEGEVKITVPRGKYKEVINEPVTEIEVNEFLKFISTVNITLLNSCTNYRLRFLYWL